MRIIIYLIALALVLHAMITVLVELIKNNFPKEITATKKIWMIGSICQCIILISLISAIISTIK